MSDLGLFLKEKRESFGISQRVLGESIGVTDTTINNIESGKTKSPKWDLLCKIARKLDFHPFEILKVAGYIEDCDINPVYQIHGYEALTSEEKKEVQHFIDFLIVKKNT